MYAKIATFIVSLIPDSYKIVIMKALLIVGAFVVVFGIGYWEGWSAKGTQLLEEEYQRQIDDHKQAIERFKQSIQKSNEIYKTLEEEGKYLDEIKKELNKIKHEGVLNAELPDDVVGLLNNAITHKTDIDTTGRVSNQNAKP